MNKYLYLFLMVLIIGCSNNTKIGDVVETRASQKSVAHETINEFSRSKGKYKETKHQFNGWDAFIVHRTRSNVGTLIHFAKRSENYKELIKFKTNNLDYIKLSYEKKPEILVSTSINSGLKGFIIYSTLNPEKLDEFIEWTQWISEGIN